MKKLLTSIVLSAALLTMPTGCAHDPATKVAQVEGVTIKSVNFAMRVWADWVNDGRATKEQIAAVKDAYETYYNAQRVAKAALTLYVASKSEATEQNVALTSAAVVNAQDALIALIQKYTR